MGLNLDTLNQAIEALDDADAILVGAGAGMSIPAGIDLTDREGFARHYPAMLQYGFKYGYQLMGYPYSDERLRWGFLSASLMNSARLGIDPSYQKLKQYLDGRDHFIMTSNVDRLFHKNGFDPKRIYTPQGDSFLLQCKVPCCDHTWEAIPLLEEMERHIDPATQYLTDPELVPACPNCGGPVYMNVRGGAFFIERHYEPQLRALNHWLEGGASKRLVLLEIGVGFNTPGVIRAPFERLAAGLEQCTLIRINPGEAFGPQGTLSLNVGVEEALEHLL